MLNRKEKGESSYIKEDPKEKKKRERREKKEERDRKKANRRTIQRPYDSSMNYDRQASKVLNNKE